MRIVADQNIPYVQEAFGALGTIEIVPSRRIDAALVKNADMLLVRSVTRVGAELLEASTVRFVGTATIGTDHVDEGYLRDRGIAFASAPGSNANSVAEYVTAALLLLSRRGRFGLAGKTIGVVGIGNVGRRVVRMAEAMGMSVLQNDPPLARQTGDPRFLPIEALFATDVLTLHVPLTREGQDATWHMVDEAFLSRLRPGAILINTSRGAVVESGALHRALQTERLDAAVVDTWENEPRIDTSLLGDVAIGTPHIAGYSLDGKVNATAMLYEAACRCLSVRPTWEVASVLPPPQPRRVEARFGDADEGAPHEIVRQVYDIERDDRALREVLRMPESQRGEYFDRLRATYPARREFFNIDALVPAHARKLADQLTGLGFRVRQTTGASSAATQKGYNARR